MSLTFTNESSKIWTKFAGKLSNHENSNVTRSERQIQKHKKRLDILKRRQRRRRGRLFSKEPSLLVAFAFAVFFFVTFVVIFGESVLLPEDESVWCKIDKSLYPSDYENPDYDIDPCNLYRTYYLLFVTKSECDFLRRLLSSVLFGGIIGYERRASDRPAGIRTMGLVSLGSCSFTLSSIAAFKSSTMGWDSSRVTAAIPSGVGFLGAGLIWKGKIGQGENEVHQVHGLTTAASLWLSAAVGSGSGGALYFETAYVVVLVLMVLRVGPKLMSEYDVESDDEEEDIDDVHHRNRVHDSNLLVGMDQVDNGEDIDESQSISSPKKQSRVSATFHH